MRTLLKKKEVEDIVVEVLRERFKIDESIREKLNILERLTRVEEELKALRGEMQARFEAIDKRFEVLRGEMNTRFEAIDKRFTLLTWFIGVGFFLLALLIALLKIFG